MVTPGLCPQLQVPALCHPMCIILSPARGPHGCSCPRQVGQGWWWPLSPAQVPVPRCHQAPPALQGSRAGQSHVPTVTRSTSPSAPAVVPTVSLCPHGLPKQGQHPSWLHFEPRFHPPFISCCLLDASCPPMPPCSPLGHWGRLTLSPSDSHVFLGYWGLLTALA